MKCDVTMCVFCGASLPVSSNNNKYEEHLQDWHNITIYQEVETAMARSRHRDTVRGAGSHGEKDRVTELCETKETIIQADTADDGEDFVNVQEEFIEEEDCIDKTKTVAKKVYEVNMKWMEVLAKKDKELECLTKKLEEERKDREEELEKLKIKEDEQTIERKKDMEDMVQLRKTVEELKEEISKERVVKEKEKEKLSEEREREIKRKEIEAKKEEETKYWNGREKTLKEIKFCPTCRPCYWHS